jgi:endonuclease-3
VKDYKSYILKIIEELKSEYPNSGIALKFVDVFQLLVVVILSAQCTDERVNKVSPLLFARFKNAEDFSKCKIKELEKLIFSTGFYKNKAKHIKGASQKIVELFNGEVPNNMADLLKLSGVARKTANVVLAEGYGKSEGIVVDTHVIRLSGLLGLVPKKIWQSKNAVKIEARLMEITPKKYWRILPHLFMSHGRKICIARRPRCEGCSLNSSCPSSKV